MLVALLDSIRTRAQAHPVNREQPRHWYSGRPIPREMWQWTSEDYAEADRWGVAVMSGIAVLILLVVIATVLLWLAL